LATKPVRDSSRAMPMELNTRGTATSQSADPWAMTHCVLAIRPDPADPTRWWLENECGTPVAILFSVCERSAAQCDGSNSWKYPTNAVLLPAKSQRSVTYAEQTRYGEHIRYVACAVTTSSAAELIDKERDSRTSRAVTAALDAVRANDDCIARADHWSEIGRRSGASIDTMLGNHLRSRHVE
jgi:hypothetical protein